MEDLYQFDEEYRDSIATVDEKGKRIWIYPKKPSGSFHNLRIFVSIALLAILFGLPFIKVDGDPLMLIDVFERKFIILGIHLWPQDFHIVALSMISLVVFVVLFTVVFGRVWCGWACPQTIFMEMVLLGSFLGNGGFIDSGLFFIMSIKSLDFSIWYLTYF